VGVSALTETAASSAAASIASSSSRGGVTCPLCGATGGCEHVIMRLAIGGREVPVFAPSVEVAQRAASELLGRLAANRLLQPTG